MQKQDLLHELEGALLRQEISREEILALFSQKEMDESHSPRATEGNVRKFGLPQLLTYLGGGIVFLGIAIFVGQQWMELSSALRIFLTLGSGLALFASATFLAAVRGIDRVPDALYVPASMLIPGGVFVTLHELGFSGSAFGPGMIFLAFTIMYTIAFRFIPRGVLLLFAVLFGSLSFILLTDAMAEKTLSFDGDRFAFYRMFAVALSVFTIGLAYRDSIHSTLAHWFVGIGTFGVLAFGLALGGWQPSQSIAWELGYIPLVFIVLYGAIFFKSRAMLAFGALFLAGYLIKITSEYFSSSTAWPPLLAFAGAVLIGTGYVAFRIDQKFITK